MKTFIPKKPVGDSALWTWRRWIWDILAGGNFPIKGDGNVIVQWQQGVYRISSKPMPSGTYTFPWQTPKELDPTVAVPKDKFVELSPLNPLVTSGLIDISLGVLVKALPGTWQALQDVPAKDGDGNYNVPQLPYPGAGAVPSGTPLKGDLDGTDGSGKPLVFWKLWTPYPVCPNV